MSELPALLTTTIVWMCRIAALAAAVNALELITMRQALSDRGVWRAPLLSPRWGVWGLLLGPRAFLVVLVAQLALAVILAVAPGTTAGCVAAAALAFTSWLAALRFRGNVNGGSDAMLFTVLGGLAVAQLPNVTSVVHEGGVLYIAAQLTLSYVRAGIVKAKERSWWSGRALSAFLALPAYGVPAWAQRRVPNDLFALRIASAGVIAFECLAPLAWFDRIACIALMAMALTFHTATAALFGLNRFLLAWSAALPSLWYAVHRVR
ncbi:hypothetical protein [Gemmatimonas groenlandica]|uniref:HTTM-like domain-containing protein n=1 Tax=Gemmatimonas groenlandica TaxID=2732249 RepID=A0A6M4IPG5_9BACT|nr:hypothetical protein [Gemmatimonas groenlandica]QJR36824.1 hypothetical protein HKW67_15510 [Gemmatimonas groenlandica]